MQQRTGPRCIVIAGPNGAGKTTFARRAERADFAFESTLSGLSYARQLGSWKGMGYRIEIAYLRLSSSQLALRRIAARVRQGGPDVPRS